MSTISSQEVISIVKGEIEDYDAHAGRIRETGSVIWVGDGIAIEPSSDTVVAPADSTVNAVMADTGHACGLTFAMAWSFDPCRGRYR